MTLANSIISEESFITYKDSAKESDVGRPLVGLQGSNEDF
jgi:hypothetical protein